MEWNKTKNCPHHLRESSYAIISRTYHQFRSWAAEFEIASLETKKMIACQLFTRVEIGKGYRVHIELNTTYRQFLDDWRSGTVIEAIAG